VSRVAELSAAGALEAEGRLLEAINCLTSANRERSSPEIERRLVRLRYEAFELLDRTDFHQDGAFLGREIRALNVWLALSDCGGDADARGLEFVPHRLDLIRESARDSDVFDWAVSATTAERLADGLIAGPRFAPGDGLLFDELLLHRTAVSARAQDRYAIESWFFAASSYPGNHVPVVC
jgi:hypothetical protein